MADSDARTRVLLALAAVGWLAAMVLPLTTRGAGSAVSGHALADLASAGRLPDFPSWLGPAWYLMPLGGGVVLVSLGIRGAPASAARWCAAAIATASALTFTVLVTDLDISRFGAGTWTGVTSSAFVACAVCLQAVQHLRDRRGQRVLH